MRNTCRQIPFCKRKWLAEIECRNFPTFYDSSRCIPLDFLIIAFDMARSAASSPVAPPPPPPPPPPQLELEAGEPPKGKLMDFREILSLFHAREPPTDAWEALWLATLAEAREAAPKRPPQPPAQQPRGRTPSDAVKSGGPEPPKRPRQVRMKRVQIEHGVRVVEATCVNMCGVSRAPLPIWSPAS